MMFDTVDAVQKAFADQNYVAERGLATAVYLAVRLRKPLFLEGEAGVGKTEVAKVLAALIGTEFIRLQCYEGVDVSSALYEWNYARQLLHLRLLEASGAGSDEMRESLFTREFLHSRPLLRAVEAGTVGYPPVLLIDEIDRADEEFEAFLLELLSDFQVTIPELGTVVSLEPPVVVVTSNRTREVHDALKRRCLYYWIDYPSFEKELRIVRAKAPDVELLLVRQVVAFVQELRREGFFKLPGVAESLDWVAAMVALDQHELSLEVVQDTVGVVLKYKDDVDILSSESVKALLDRAKLQAEIVK
jgi:MoxR-like ATPase